MSDRTATVGADGRVIVRERERKLTARKKRDVLAFVGRGSSKAAAARAVGVSSATLHRELRDDPEFAGKMDDALGGLLEEVEGALVDLALNGSTRRFYDRKTGELAREEDVPNVRAMEVYLGAHSQRYKPAAAQTNVIVIPPLSSEELSKLREVGRADVEVTDQLAEAAAAAEWDRDQRLLTAGGKT